MKTVFLWLSLLVVCISCRSLGNPSTSLADESNLMTGARVQFVYEDIHPSFWTKPTLATMFLDVFVFYQGRRLSASDIKEMRLHDVKGLSWTIAPEVTHNYIGGWERIWAFDYTWNQSVISLGRYTLEIITSQVKVCSRVYDPTDPQPANANSKSYVYSADYLGRKDERYAECIRRARIKEASLEDEQIRVLFSINDSRVENGKTSFYDKNKKWIGESIWFKNIYSLESLPGLNQGTGLRVDGGDNELLLKEVDVRLGKGRSLSEIEYMNVVTEAGGEPGITPTEDETIYLARSEMVVVRGNKQEHNKSLELTAWAPFGENGRRLRNR